MTDELDPTPGQPGNPGQQGGSNPTPAGGDNWEARYKGTVPVIERLTRENRELKEQLATLTSEKEQLTAQLALKDTEKQAAVGERDKQLQELIEAKSQTDKELAELRALALKVKVAKSLGQPELLEILDTIPAVQDEEALTTIMKTFSDWGSKMAKKREDELLAGVTPKTAPVTTPTETLPTTSEGWAQYVEKFELGSPERQKAYDQWREWGLASQKR